MTGAYQLRRDVGPGEQLCYAVGDAGFNLVWTMYDSFLLYFLLQVARLPVWSITPIVFCSRSADLAASIAFGLFGDRVRTRYGSYRPYLVLVAVPTSVAFIALFTPAPFATTVLMRNAVLLWTGLAAVSFAVLYACGNAAYTALLAVLTPSDAVRMRVASLRFAFAAAAVVVVQYFALPLASRFGGGHPARGWTGVAALCAIGCAAAMGVTAAGTRERLTVGAPFAVDLRLTARDLAGEPGLGWLVLGMVFCLAALSCRGAAAPFYFQTCAGHVEWTGGALAANSLAAFLVCVSVPAVFPARWLAPVPLACACAAAGAVLCALPPFWFAATHARPLLLQACFGAGTGLLLPTLFVLLASFPHRAISRLTPALLAAITLLSLKAGSAIGALLASYRLAHAGTGLARSELQAHAIGALFTVWPATLFALTFLCLIFAGMRHRTPFSAQD